MFGTSSHIVAEDWKNLLAWQVVDPRTATIQEMLQAPIVFSTGTKLPSFRRRPRRTSSCSLNRGVHLRRRVLRQPGI